MKVNTWGHFHCLTINLPLRFNLSLSADVSGPLSIVLVGDGFSTVTNDYGSTWTDTVFSTEIHSNDLRRGACWGMGQFLLLEVLTKPKSGAVLTATIGQNTIHIRVG